MRNPRHDYGRKNGYWWAEHREVVWTPQETGPFVTINGYAFTQAELVVANLGALENDRVKWRNWRMGDPKLPDPDLSSILQELPSLSIEQAMARAREIDASWDRYNADQNRRRYGHK